MWHCLFTYFLFPFALPKSLERKKNYTKSKTKREKKSFKNSVKHRTHMYHKNRAEAQRVRKRNQKEEKSLAKKLEHQINPV